MRPPPQAPGRGHRGTRPFAAATPAPPAAPRAWGPRETADAASDGRGAAGRPAVLSTLRPHPNRCARSPQLKFAK